jgi:hypothetical protein
MPKTAFIRLLYLMLPVMVVAVVVVTVTPSPIVAMGVTVTVKGAIVRIWVRAVPIRTHA